MLKVVDYGAGNLFSLANALKYLNIEYAFARDAEELAGGEGILLPGVGAFPVAMRMLGERGFPDALKSSKVPVLGICLGMQLLFERSEEFGICAGLGLIPGEVKRITGEVTVPHMGWNSLSYRADSPITRGIAEGSYVYFVHSYRAVCGEEYAPAYAEYGQEIPAVVQDSLRRVFGCQFHPEKSGSAGLAMLENFAAFCREVSPKNLKSTT